MKATGSKIDLMLWVSLCADRRVRRPHRVVPQPDVHHVEAQHLLLGARAWSSGPARRFFHKNLFRSTLGADIELPDTVWQRFNFSWVAFFALMGLLNLVVVYFVRDYWVSFHTFGQHRADRSRSSSGSASTSASTSSPQPAADKPAP